MVYEVISPEAHGNGTIVGMHTESPAVSILWIPRKQCWMLRAKSPLQAQRKNMRP